MTAKRQSHKTKSGPSPAGGCDLGTVRVALAQISPVLGDRKANLEMHLEQIEAARRQDADLIVFPELSLTGYSVRDMVPDLALSRSSPELESLFVSAGKTAVVAGFVEESAQHRFYNTAFHAEGGRITHLHRKVYLPTYGLFDEQRYFAAGERITAFDSARLGRVGILVCEDFWHLSAATIMLAEEVDVLICVANSPARGVDGPKIHTAETYEQLARSYSQLLGAVVIVVNRVGFEDGLCFWGGSMVVGPDGRTIARAPMLDPALTLAEFDPIELRRQRLITPLARDEKLLLTIEELSRIRRQHYASGVEYAEQPANRSEPPRPRGEYCSDSTTGSGRVRNPDDIEVNLEINAELVTDILCRFIRNEIHKAGFERVILGLSGGIDSSVVAYLSARAMGPENVLAVTMPYKTSSEATVRDSQRVVEQLGVSTIDLPITDQVDAYFARLTDATQLRLANKCARERMTILYDQSVAFEGLVLGTSNKSELLLGYGTQFGDLASAINPVGDLYKTQLLQLAKHLGVPKSIRQKRPTGDLWVGQTDEDELGFTYADVDRLLALMVDRRWHWAELVEAGFESDFVDRVARMIRRNQYKRRMPVIAKLSHRTVDRDFRYARDWGT